MATIATPLILTNNTEIIEKKVDIDNALSRCRRPLESTLINLDVYGVFSLPDSWKSKVVVLVFETFLGGSQRVTVLV